ncbi:MAG: WD40 repeat domain-containing serine/threonine protein kinase [Acidobacteriota bacterium]
MPDEGKPGDAPTLGTMQLPRGGNIEELAGSAPLQATVVPASGAPIATTKPLGAPPAMPADWRYAIKTEIARGGMGRVVEAHDTVLGRTVALKEALARDPEAVRRFQRETRITARLEHPSIVPVHDAGMSPSGAPFYVMRKVSGRPLEELVSRGEQLEDRLALLPHIVAAAHAVAHAHERGIVHRDIKPSNILVGDLGETIVIDWGLAKAMNERDDPHAGAEVDDADVVTTRAGIVFGTPGFMAPEQLRGGSADEKTDVYALGATLYYLLARRPPHYSKSADDIMKAAAAGPPEPLRELLPGVPPELATIVDKALAHDVRHRYQDAGALAEDLQRFLTGQLVASHHYSRREKLLRFVRKNRALVAVSGAAALALIVGAWFSIHRIVGERDRANVARNEAVVEKQKTEDALEAVKDKNRELTLTSARNKTEDDPTRAVAMIAQLATDKHWRTARAIGAAARAHGVAFGLPASREVDSLEMSRDGQRVLAAGGDGAVIVYDLAKRTQKQVADVHGPAQARFADGDHAIAIAHADRLTIIDIATGRQRDVTATTPIAELAVSGPIAYWTDQHGALWKADVAAGTPEQVTIDGPVRALATSPDGRWIALASDARLLLLDRTQPTLPAQQLAEGRARQLAWSAGGTHLAVLVGDEALAFEMPSGQIAQRITVGARTAVAFSRGKLYATGPTGVGMLERDNPHPRHVNGDFTLGLYEARGGILVTASVEGVIAVISADDDRILHAPGLHLARVAASPGSPWIVAAGEGRLLAWDVEAIEPRVVATAASGARFVTGDALVTTSADGGAQWIDLLADKATPLPPTPEGIYLVTSAPDGSRALVVDGTHHGRIVAPLGATQDVDGDLDLAAFADDQRLVVATSAGALRLELPKHRELVAHAGGIAALAARGDWVAAAFKDGGLWRTNLATGKTSTLGKLAAPPRDGLALAANGDVLVAKGTALVAWRADGSQPTLATFDKAISRVALAGATPLAITGDGALRVVGASRDTPMLAPRASIAADGLVATTSADGVLELIDPLAGERWTLAQPEGRTFSFVELAPDGRRVLAVTTAGVLVWPLALPATREDTATWLESLTNAVDRGPTAPLDWR